MKGGNKVFGLGLSRTATSTMAHVLREDLGHNHIHYPRQSQIFDPTNDGCSDIPVIPHFKKLSEVFPDAKFILTIRDKESWMASMEPYLARKTNWKMSKGVTNLRTKVYGAPFFDRDKFSEAFDRHHEDVINYFDGERLLVLDIIGGDKPKKLFDFLGISDQIEPPKVFPVKNKLGLGICN